MIILFSGTGNTRYAAEVLSSLTDDKIYDITRHPAETIKLDGERLIFMFPVYAWGPMPDMVEYVNSFPETVIETIKQSNIPVSIVCTCGDETGKAVDVFEKALNSRGLSATGAWSLIMPNVYVLLPGFDVDPKKLAEDKLDDSLQRIKLIAQLINNNEYKRDVTEGSLATLKTKIVYPLFRRWGINYKKWHWTKECIGCGKCASVCPVNNIAMKGGHPVWGKNCKSCLACYGICPTHAVAYANITEFKGQYYCHRRLSKS